MLWYSFFDQPKVGFVRAKKYLAAHHDWQIVIKTPKHYQYQALHEEPH